MINPSPDVLHIMLAEIVYELRRDEAGAVVREQSGTVVNMSMFYTGCGYGRLESFLTSSVFMDLHRPKR
jgi:hypothetical protein